MHVINARNVNNAYALGLEYLRNQGVLSETRAGNALVSPVPVTTVYACPRERVLFDAQRDANPFFHLFESLWMLAGRNDAKWLDRFVGNFSSRFAEEDGRQHGAYGHRWRHQFGYDQLESVIEKLKNNAADRQVVIQMWDASVCTTDGMQAEDLRGDWKDRPCNTHIYSRIRTEVETVGASQASGLGGAHQEPVSYLDLTVCCRSNDAIWGAYGANAVHFSVLQEYLAARLGVHIGVYYQVSNNFHVYTNPLGEVGQPSFLPNPYETTQVCHKPMVTVPDAFDEDLLRFMAWTGDVTIEEIPTDNWLYHNKWFSNTAQPLFEAHWNWKAGQRGNALDIVRGQVGIATDWQLAAREWMERRMLRRRVKTMEPT